VKIAVLDRGEDHHELALRMARAAAAGPLGGESDCESDGESDGESGRGLQIVTSLFPGAWGAEPVATCTGVTPAKQAWFATSHEEGKK
jgi:hypothetical protein